MVKFNKLSFPSTEINKPHSYKITFNDDENDNTFESLVEMFGKRLNLKSLQSSRKNPSEVASI